MEIEKKGKGNWFVIDGDQEVQFKTKREAEAYVEKKDTKGTTKQQSFQHEGSMAQFVDNLLTEGTDWNTLLEKCQKEAKRRDIKSLNTAGSIKAHMRFRRSKGMTFPEYEVQGEKV